MTIELLCIYVCDAAAGGEMYILLTSTYKYLAEIEMNLGIQSSIDDLGQI